MKVKFLGTIAAEGGPALFCNCDICKEARRRGGKDIRTRSQILVNDDLLVDFPADTYFHKIKYDINMSRVRYLLITHSHSDHFYPNDLWQHAEGPAHDMDEPVLHVYSNEAVKNRFDMISEGKVGAEVTSTLDWYVVNEFEKLDVEDYDVWSLKARHMPNENALFYLIKQGDKAFMQCNDTGLLFEEDYDFLSSLGVKIDVISLDATMGINGQYSGHMNLQECFDTVERMRASNFVKPETRFVITHFSHNGLLLHSDYEQRCAPFGIEVAYDGFEIEF